MIEIFIICFFIGIILCFFLAPILTALGIWGVIKGSKKEGPKLRDLIKRRDDESNGRYI